LYGLWVSNVGIPLLIVAYSLNLPLGVRNIIAPLMRKCKKTGRNKDQAPRLFDLGNDVEKTPHIS
jgi:hypothetical protein